MASRASIAIGADGAAYFVYRGQDSKYWLGRYYLTGQVDGFYQLGSGVFTVDPAIVGPAESGKFIVVAGNSSGLFHSRITPNSSFFLSTVEPWSGMGCDVTNGRPGVGLGADGRAYVYCLYNGAVWNAKLGGALNSFEGWWLGPQTAGVMDGELSVASSPVNSQLYVLAKRLQGEPTLRINNRRVRQHLDYELVRHWRYPG